MGNDSQLENVLRKVAIGFGIVMLLASIYLSYDGFDQRVEGGNSQYTALAAAIGIALAVVFSILEFVLSSRPEGLNTTLKVLGVVAYVYSIYTNFLGAQNLLHMDNIMAGITAVAMDIVPEPLIAWGLGEALMHDLFGNLGKFAVAPVGKKGGGGGGGNHGNQNQNHQNRQNHQKQHGGGGGGGNQYRPQSRQMNINGQGSQGGGSNRRQELERQFHAAPASGNNGKNGSKPPPYLQALFEEIEEDDE